MPRNPALRPVSQAERRCLHQEGNDRYTAALDDVRRAIAWLTGLGMPVLAVAILRTGPVIHVAPSPQLHIKLDDVADIGQTNHGGLLKRRYAARRYDVQIQWEELQ